MRVTYPKKKEKKKMKYDIDYLFEKLYNLIKEIKNNESK